VRPHLPGPSPAPALRRRGRGVVGARRDRRRLGRPGRAAEPRASLGRGGRRRRPRARRGQRRAGAAARSLRRRPAGAAGRRPRPGARRDGGGPAPPARAGGRRGAGAGGTGRSGLRPLRRRRPGAPRLRARCRSPPPAAGLGRRGLRRPRPAPLRSRPPAGRRHRRGRLDGGGGDDRAGRRGALPRRRRPGRARPGGGRRVRRDDGGHAPARASAPGRTGRRRRGRPGTSRDRSRTGHNGHFSLKPPEVRSVKRGVSNAAPGGRMRRNAGEVVVAVAAVLWSGWLLFGTGHPSSQTVSNLGLTIVPFVAAVACVRRAWLRSAGAMRWSWMLLGGSCAAWGVGQLIWTVYETGFGREVPFPSWADAGYLMAVPLAAAGLIVMPAATQTIAGRLRIVLDGVMVAVALFCTSWILVLGPLFAAGGDGLLATVLSLAYPVGDVVTITMLIFAILRARLGGEAGRQPLYLIGLGLTAIALSDSAFVYLTSQTSYGSGSFIDIGWFVGFAVLFVAARRPERAAPRAHEEHGLRSISSLTIAYAPVVVMAVTVLLQHLIGETLDGPAEAAAMAVLLLIVLRQVLTLRENFALVRNLEERVESRTSELRRGEERFRSLVQNSSDVVTIADADGTIRYLSPSVRRVFGYEYRDLLGTSLA